MESKLLWQPSEEQINNSHINKFRNFVNLKYNINLNDYNDLYNWSINYIANFWQSFWEFSDIIYSENYKNILTLVDKNNPNDIRNYKWFDGAKLNFAENLLRFRDEEIALLYSNEDGKIKSQSYYELYKNTAKLVNTLKKLNVKQGDRIAAYISNNIEAVTGMLATSSIGAIWTSTSPDFGVQGVLDRFSQVEPKILIAVDGYYYNGKKIEVLNTIKNIIDKISSIEKVILINQVDSELPDSNKYMYWDDALDNEANEIEFVQLDFNHPLYIMYTSGTTGVPKCIVHGQGGTLIQHLKELILHTNLSDLDTITYFTTCGWMMWNWLISSLAIGSTVVLLDGSPIYPNIKRLWNLIDELKITVFGTSPKFINITKKENYIPKLKNKLQSLRAILSTGSPLSEEDFEWIYENVKKDLQLSSISGGTDIISCFMLGNPVLPVYSGEIQCRGLGMKVEAWDDNNKPVVNQKGELVCTLPFPSMPTYFWNDENNQKYNDAYFNYYPGIWRHGDYIIITENNGVKVLGRSDATLNPGGVRIGTAEIYRVVEQLNEIKDSIVVGVPKENDVEIYLFVVTNNDLVLDNNLSEKIKLEIRKNLTPRHIPREIHQIKEVPYTLNGKKVELAVLKTILGEEVKNKSALMNPNSLEQFKNII
jgi:acetoacetyl-CoA synthetase